MVGPSSDSNWQCNYYMLATIVLSSGIVVALYIYIYIYILLKLSYTVTEINSKKSTEQKIYENVGC